MTEKTEIQLRLNVIPALRETVGGLTRSWRGAWGAIVLTIAAALASGPAPSSGPWPILIGVVTFVATLALVGGLLRIALGDDAPVRGLGPGGLQIGRAEARLVGAALLCLLLIAMIVAVLGIVLLAGAGMAELNADAIATRDWTAAGEGWKLAVVAAAGLGAVAILVSLVVRLSLFAPATVAQGRMVSLDSFLIARGSAWPLLAGLAITSAPVVILTLMSTNGVLIGRAGSVIWPVVLAALQAPLTTGFTAAAYRRLARS